MESDNQPQKRVKKQFSREEWEKQQAQKGPISASNLSGKQLVNPSPSFVKYYQQMLGSSEEWDLFVKVISQELPTTFRIASIGGLTHLVVHV